MKHLLAIGEASVRLGVGVTTLRGWDRDVKIQCYRTPFGHRRFALVEIERIISGNLTEDVVCFGVSESLSGSKTAMYINMILPFYMAKKIRTIESF